MQIIVCQSGVWATQGPNSKFIRFQHDLSNVGDYEITGLGFFPKTVHVQIAASGLAGGAMGFATKDFLGGCITNVHAIQPGTWTYQNYPIVVFPTSNGSVYSVAYFVNWRMDGITLRWSKQGLPTGVYTVQLLISG